MERLFFWLSVRDGNQQYWRRCHLAYDDCVMSTIYFLCVRILAVIKVRRKVPVRKGTWKAWGMDSFVGDYIIIVLYRIFNRGISESRYGALRVEKNIKNFTKFLQHIVDRKIEIRYMW